MCIDRSHGCGISSNGDACVHDLWCYGSTKPGDLSIRVVFWWQIPDPASSLRSSGFNLVINGLQKCLAICKSPQRFLSKYFPLFFFPPVFPRLQLPPPSLLRVAQPQPLAVLSFFLQVGIRRESFPPTRAAPVLLGLPTHLWLSKCFPPGVIPGN